MKNIDPLILKFDNSFNGRLFAVQADTGRVINFQILNDVNTPVDITGMSIRFYVGSSKQVAYSDGTITDAAQGKVEVPITNSMLAYPGMCKSQFVLTEGDGKKIGSKVFDLYVEESIENGATVGKNIVVDYSKIDEAVNLLKDYDKTLQDAKETGFKLKVDIDVATETDNKLKENIELARTFDFDGDIQKAKETRDDLVTKTTAADKAKTSLDESVKTAETANTSLTESIDASNTAKENLDKSISTGQGLNDSLSSKIQSATAVDGAIKTKMDTVQGWIDNPLQFKGDKGDQGIQGSPGPIGKGLTVLGKVTSSSQLPSTGSTGDAYFVGSQLYVWTGSKWEDMGKVKGEKGDPATNLVKSVQGKTGDVMLTKEDITALGIPAQDEMPSKVSQLVNDSNFKTETEIQSMINNASKLKKEVVTSLPTTGKDDVIYLIKNKSDENNVYTEYLWIGGKWEIIGDTKIDLSGYATKDEIPTKVSQLENDKNFKTEEEILKLINDSNKLKILTLDEYNNLNPKDEEIAYVIK